MQEVKDTAHNICNLYKQALSDIEHDIESEAKEQITKACSHAFEDGFNLCFRSFVKYGGDYDQVLQALNNEMAVRYGIK